MKKTTGKTLKNDTAHGRPARPGLHPTKPPEVQKAPCLPDEQQDLSHGDSGKEAKTDEPPADGVQSTSGHEDLDPNITAHLRTKLRAKYPITPERTSDLFQGVAELAVTPLNTARYETVLKNALGDHLALACNAHDFACDILGWPKEKAATWLELFNGNRWAEVEPIVIPTPVPGASEHVSAVAGSVLGDPTPIEDNLQPGPRTGPLASANTGVPATIEELPLDAMDPSFAAQVREAISGEAVENYAECFLTGESLPPISVYKINGSLKIVDGHHRFLAAKKAGLTAIQTKVVSGTEEDAFVAALGSNSQHGLRRTNADKRRVVTLALQKLKTRSDREIASVCRVSHNFVGQVRKQLSPDDSSEPRVGKDGKTRQLPTKAPQQVGKETKSEDCVDHPDEAQPANSCPIAAQEMAPEQAIVDPLERLREQVKKLVEPVIDDLLPEQLQQFAEFLEELAHAVRPETDV